MDGRIQQGLDQDRIIDITTHGRRSGQKRRIEIWFHNIDGERDINEWLKSSPLIEVELDFDKAQVY